MKETLFVFYLCPTVPVRARAKWPKTLVHNICQGYVTESVFCIVEFKNLAEICSNLQQFQNVCEYSWTVFALRSCALYISDYWRRRTLNREQARMLENIFQLLNHSYRIIT